MSVFTIFTRTSDGAIQRYADRYFLNAIHAGSIRLVYNDIASRAEVQSLT